MFSRIQIIFSVIVTFCGFRQVQPQQTFIRSCNDPFVLTHIGRYQHTYCHHACGFPSSGVSECSAGGYCVCPCDPNLPQATFGADICPQAGAIPDTDPESEPNCLATCSNLCPGGIGSICGEIDVTNGKICTCICPPSTCPRIESAAPDEMVIIPVTAMVKIIPLPLILKKIKLFVSIMLTKYYIYGFLGLSLMGHFFYLKLFVWLIYEILLFTLNALLRRLGRILLPAFREIFQIIANHFVDTQNNN